MAIIDDDQTQRLLEVLHRGFEQIRNLALGCGQEKIADLADALEVIPLVMRGVAGDQELIHVVLEGYKEKYPNESHYVVSPYLLEPVAPTK